MEREPRKEITLKQANEIAEEVERLEHILSQINRSEFMVMLFVNQGASRIYHEAENISVEYARMYVEQLEKELDHLKEKRKNSILIDW